MSEIRRKCPFCAEEIKAEAVKCKHCGSEVVPLSKDQKTQAIREAAKANYVPYPIVFLVFIVIGFWIYFQASDGSSSAAPVSEKSSQTTESKYYIGDVAIGCNTEESYSRAFSMMVNEEWKALARMVASGRCVELPSGVRVYIEDSSFSQVKVRPAGEVTAYWTGIEVPEKR